MCELLLAQLNRPHDTANQVILIQPGINRRQVARIMKVNKLKILYGCSQGLDPLAVFSSTPNTATAEILGTEARAGARTEKKATPRHRYTMGSRTLSGLGLRTIGMDSPRSTIFIMNGATRKLPIANATVAQNA